MSIELDILHKVLYEHMYMYLLLISMINTIKMYYKPILEWIFYVLLRCSVRKVKMALFFVQNQVAH